jgi:hypothetical protein
MNTHEGTLCKWPPLAHHHETSSPPPPPHKINYTFKVKKMTNNGNNMKIGKT